MNARKSDLVLHIHLMVIMLNVAHVEAQGLLQLTLPTRPVAIAKGKVNASAMLVKRKHSERHILRMGIIAGAVRAMVQEKQMLDMCQIAEMPNE